MNFTPCEEPGRILSFTLWGCTSTMFSIWPPSPKWKWESMWYFVLDKDMGRKTEGLMIILAYQDWYPCPEFFSFHFWDLRALSILLWQIPAIVRSIWRGNSHWMTHCTKNNLSYLHTRRSHPNQYTRLYIGLLSLYNDEINFKI